MLAAGTCTIAANQAGDANYTAASQVLQNVVINTAAQTLTFPAQVPVNQTYAPNGTFAINPLATSATPNSGNPIVYSSLTGSVCSVSGTTVTMLAAGTCTIAANQLGNSNYDPASQVTQNVGLVRPASTVGLDSPCMRTFEAGQPFTLNAAVIGGTNPSGTITFAWHDTVGGGSGILCSNVTMNSAAAACTSNALAPGTFGLDASYSGDANNGPGTSARLPVTVLSTADVIFRNGYETIPSGCPMQ